MAKRAVLEKEELAIDRYRRLLIEYRPRIAIDEHDLDHELIRHPSLAREINDEYKYAMSYRDGVKHDLEIETATIDKEIRRHYEGGKVTEREIKSETVMDQSIIDLETSLREWDLVVRLWENLSAAAKDRGYMLTKLVELYISNYYSDVTGRGERSEARDRLSGEARKIAAARRGTAR